MTEPSRAIARAARRVADQQTARLVDVGSARLFRATVTTVTPGAARDGLALVMVTYRGQENTVAGYPDAYTPAVGHRVVCASIADAWSILSREVGQP